MTRDEKLKALVLKATTDSWKVPDWILVELKYNNWDFVADERVWPVIIFNHDFARALFGEDTERFWECPNYGDCFHRIDWYKHNESQMYCPIDGRKVKDVTYPKPIYEQTFAEHLQQAVISEDPIDYMYQAVFNKETK